MARVVWTDTALAEIDAIIDYVEIFDPAAAVRLAQRLMDAGNSLADFPNRGRPRGGGIRQWSLVYPYLVRYRVRDDVVEILAIRHGARRD